MKILLDIDRCQGHNRCRLIAPQLFDSDELGHAVLLEPGPLPDVLLEAARQAEANCPEFAIRLVDDT
jgi:ferredoxin